MVVVISLDNTGLKDWAMDERMILILTLVYRGENINYRVQHPVNVSIVLPIGLPKLDDWHLAKSWGPRDSTYVGNSLIHVFKWLWFGKRKREFG